MIDARNTTAHEYNQKKASMLVEEIPQYLPIIEKLLAYKVLQEN